MAFRRPHTFAVSESAEPITDNVVEVPQLTAGSAIRCLIVPSTSEAIYRDYAVEVQRGAVMFCAIPDASTLSVGDRGTSNGKTYRVAADPMDYDGGTVTNSSVVILERED